MLDKFKDNLHGKNAFTTAEMLLVLLIVSFLILAMPPLIHKKYEKRVTRGQHGRYECWKDADDGNVYEYWATEKGGPGDGMVNASTHEPQGKNRGPNGVCRFDAEKLAPDAAFFSMQVIGGGAGGSYPQYDAKNTDYYDPEKGDEKEVLLTYEGYNVRTMSGGASDGKVSYNAYLDYYGSMDASKWVRNYFPPVLSKNTVKYCSGRGHRGTPALYFLSPPGGGTHQYDYQYGSIGGRGVCYEIGAGNMAIGVNPGDGYEVKMADESSGYTMLYFFDSEWHIVNSESKDRLGITDDASPDREIGCTGSGNSSDCGLKHQSPETNKTGNADYCCTTNYNSSTNICSHKECEGTPSVAITAQRYAPTESGNHNGTVTNNCTIPGGQKGYPAPTAKDTYGNWIYTAGTYPHNALMANYPKYVNSTGNSYGNQSSSLDAGYSSTPVCGSPWQKKEDYPGTEQTVSLTSLNNLFPTKIIMKYRFGINTPTYAYAGKQGQTASLILPKFINIVEIQLGEGGKAEAPGVTDSSEIKGKSTILYARSKDKPDDVPCHEGDLDCRILLFARGGARVQGYVMGPHIYMQGNDTCKNGTYQGKLHGCLDQGAYDADFRFSKDAKFEAIPEFDRRTKTPSAMKATYGDTGRFYPGSGGDGGYTFVIDNAGGEIITSDPSYPHNNLNIQSITALGTPGTATWSVYSGIYGTGVQRNAANSIAASELSSYQCFNKSDILAGRALGTGGSPVSTTKMKDKNNKERSKLCAPKDGFPGAVVIVW